MRSLVVSLIVHEKITTTEAKAKSLRPIIEKMVTKARVNTIPNVRLLQSRLNNNREVVKKLVQGARRGDQSSASRTDRNTPPTPPIPPTRESHRVRAAASIAPEPRQRPRGCRTDVDPWRVRNGR